MKFNTPFLRVTVGQNPHPFSIHHSFFTFFLLFLSFSTCDTRDVGILYEVWHTKAAQLMAQVQSLGGIPLTTELVIQSNNEYTLNDIYAKYNLSGDIYNVQPQLGYYCLYQHRPTEPNPPVPDCVNVTQTATRHAELLLSAGIDYVSVDVTNWPMNDTNGPTDIAVLRPTEVLFEQWYTLRQQGINTPQIAVWPCSPSGSTTWQYLLTTLYNNPLYTDLVYTQNNKKIMFIPYNPTCYDPATITLIEANGGRNDVKTIPMWALFGEPMYSEGVWGFFSPCTSNNAYTTSMFGDDVSSCNQFPTYLNNTSTLTEISASGGYMVSQCALPFASPGHLRGLTIARLFEQILTLSPPHVFVSSFNEMIGGRQGPASPSKIAFNMGLPNDPQKNTVWVDTYASEFSRDIEPTIEGGNQTWIVASSCIQMYKQGQTCLTNPGTPCCTRNDKEVFGNIWSLVRTDGTDALLTQYNSERNVLVQSGQWKEKCSPIPNPTAFCIDTSDPDGRNGPFILYNTTNTGPFPTVPLYRCITQGNPQYHFFSLDEQCEGSTMESILGYISSRPGRETLRALYRCKDATNSNVRYHALDLPCDIPDGNSTPLGFVR